MAYCGPLYRLVLDARCPVPVQRRITEASARVARLPRAASVRAVTLGGQPAERVSLTAAGSAHAVLYLHGGGYVLCSARMYRGLAAQLSRASGATVYTLDYRRAPEHPYPAAVDDAVAAFTELVGREGYPAERIAIAGDSAGGGLAVAAARRLTDAGMRPAALALLSPWTDPGDLDGGERDFVVNRRWGRACADAYRGAADPHDPGFAPMYAELSALPPMLIQRSPSELLAGQIGRFTDRARAAGVDVQLRDQPRLWHSGQMLAGTLREASSAVDDVGAFLRPRLMLTARGRPSGPP